MPELPEVETIRNDLNKKIVNKKILSLDIRLKRIALPNFLLVKKVLIGNSILEVKRRGKLIIIELKKRDKILLVHLKMTGQIIYCNKDELIAGGHSTKDNNVCEEKKYTRIILYFSDESRLIFNDMRTFGYWKIVDKKELENVVSKFGLEPFDKKFTKEWLKKLLNKKNTNIKAALLDQTLIAGIGNIYADEILFLSGLRPDRIASTLKDAEIYRIHKNTKSILKKAIKHRGTTFNNYVDTKGDKGSYSKMLKVYQKENLKCSKCGSIINKIKVAGRGTRFCPVCQK